MQQEHNEVPQLWLIKVKVTGSHECLELVGECGDARKLTHEGHMDVSEYRTVGIAT